MIELRLMGPISLRAEDGREMSSILAQPKRVALLAYLAAARPRGFQRRDKLVSLFWPDTDQSRARQSLNKSVHHLRRALGEESIVSRGDQELAINEALLWCDARAFEDAVSRGEHEEALKQYAGDFVDTLFVEEAPEFDQWMSLERDRLRELAAKCAGALADSSPTSELAISHARRASELAPYDEHAVRRLMSLLSSSSEVAAASRVFDAFASRLQADLGLAPSTQTVQLHDALTTPTSSAPPRFERATIVDDRTAAHSVPESVSVNATNGRSEVTGATHIGNVVSPAPASAPNRKLARFAVAALVVAVAASALFYLRKDGTAGSTSELVADRLFVAVLDNRTGDSSMNSIGTMAADWMSQGLTSAELVNVVDAREAIALSAPNYTVAELAKKTGAGLVITGAYYKQADSVRFQLQLTNVLDASGNRSFNAVVAPAKDPTTALEPLREQALSLVAQSRAPDKSFLLRGSRRPPSYAAYREYLEGVDMYIQRREVDAYSHFAKAAELDTSFSIALLNAAASIEVSEPAITDSIITLMTANRDQLSPVSRNWLDMMKAAGRGDLEESRRLMQLLAEASPNSFFPYQYAQVQLSLGHVRDAQQTMHAIDPERGWMKGWFSYWVARAMVDHLLDDGDEELKDVELGDRQYPQSIGIATASARYFASRGKSSQLDSILDAAMTMPARPNWDCGSVFAVAALEAATHGHAQLVAGIRRRALQWYETLPAADRVRERGGFGLTWVLYSIGAFPELTARLDTLRRRSPNDERWQVFQGIVAAAQGNREAAGQVDAQLRARIDTTGGTTSRVAARLLYGRARIAAFSGERDRAVELLTQALAKGFHYSVYLHTEPAFASLRGYAPFQRVIAPR